MGALSDRTLAAIVLVAAFLAASPDLLARLVRLKPLPLHRRAYAHVRHALSR